MALDLDEAGSRLQVRSDAAPAGGLPAALSGLLDHLRAAGPDQRPALAAALGRELEKARPGEDAAAVAAVVLRALDSKALVDLEAPDGVAPRARAVGALLALGYPWALHVDPVDLQFFREHGGRRRRARSWLVAALLAAAALAGAGAWLAGVYQRQQAWDRAATALNPPVVSTVRAPLPAAAKAAGVTGPVELLVEVLPDGRVGEVRVVSEPGYGTGAAAREAVKQYRFEPYAARPLERSHLVSYTYLFAREQ